MHVPFVRRGRLFIPELIDIGTDILNPVQVSAAGMDPSSLKRKYGKKLAFHGAIDEQFVLSSGSADEVRKAVVSARDILGAGGGYIMTSTHLLQDDIPIENILAMYDVSLR